MTKWFGVPWGTPACTANTEVPTPIGEPCVRCGRAIKAGDQGFILPDYADMNDTIYHQACLLKGVTPHERWAQADLVPDQGDGFELKADGKLECPHCLWAYDPANGSWYYPERIR